VRRVVSAIGRVLVTAGILILLFVAYQLWGTGIYTSREQSRLRSDFAATLRRHPDTTSTSTTSTTLGSAATSTPTTASTTPTTSAAPTPSPVEGDPIGRIRIPKIGVDDIVVNGTSRDDLRKGPGHYLETPLPGQLGGSAIAGHRTTYGAPFGDLDQLRAGDEIHVQTVKGDFTYRVYKALVVDPTDVGVIQPDGGYKATLTLTTCNPKYSAAQRLVVKSHLEEPALPAPVIIRHPSVIEAGLSGDVGSKQPTVLWGLIVAVVGGLWWLLFHRHPRWTTWLVGVVPFAVVLFFFYTYLERVLPANY
jgi:sortase A